MDKGENNNKLTNEEIVCIWETLRHKTDLGVANQSQFGGRRDLRQNRELSNFHWKEQYFDPLFKGKNEDFRHMPFVGLWCECVFWYWCYFWVYDSAPWVHDG